MSKAMDVFDYLVARIPEVLVEYVRLSNPYKLEENSELFLKKGFGVRIGGATNLKEVVGCHVLHESRQFTLVLTRKYYALEQDGAQKAAAEKALMDDSFALKKDIETNPQFGGLTTSASYESDSGVQYVFSEKDRFIFNEITVTAQYVEDLT